MRHYVNIRNAGIAQGLPAHCTRTTGDEEESVFGYLWWGDRGDWWLVLWDCDSPVLHPGVVAITARGAQEDATCLLWAQSYLAKHCEDFILIIGKRNNMNDWQETLHLVPVDSLSAQGGLAQTHTSIASKECAKRICCTHFATDFSCV